VIYSAISSTCSNQRRYETDWKKALRFQADCFVKCLLGVRRSPLQPEADFNEVQQLHAVFRKSWQWYATSTVIPRLLNRLAWTPLPGIRWHAWHKRFDYSWCWSWAGLIMAINRFESYHNRFIRKSCVVRYLCLHDEFKKSIKDHFWYWCVPPRPRQHLAVPVKNQGFPARCRAWTLRCYKNSGWRGWSTASAWPQTQHSGVHEKLFTPAMHLASGAGSLSPPCLKGRNDQFKEAIQIWLFSIPRSNISKNCSWKWFGALYCINDASHNLV